jgi:kinesin family protein 2/24
MRRYESVRGRVGFKLYMQIVRPIVEAAFNRSKVTCFAYGQTGSGKTYTMLGDVEQRVPGLYLLAAYDIFALLE